MVDRQARDKMAELLRHLASGTMTVGQFAEEMPSESEDRAVREAVRLYQMLYEDLYHSEWDRRLSLGLTEYPDDDQCLDCRFEGEHALDARKRDSTEHMILFLQSDLDWPTRLEAWPRRIAMPLLVAVSPGIVLIVCVFSGAIDNALVCLLSLVVVPVLAFKL